MGVAVHYDYLVVCHLFYPDETDALLEKLSAFDKYKTLFSFNVATPIKEDTIKIIQKKYPDALLYTTPNKGRDIGAKLFMINALLQLNVDGDYLFIVHDKKSPHLSQGSVWREELLSIIEPRNLVKVGEVFKDKEIGIIGAANNVKDEFDPGLGKFLCTSDAILRRLIKKMDVRPENFSFVAGSIFLIRFESLKRFFSKPSISVTDIIADLEPGNSLDFFKGTYIHSWERMLSWIVTSQGYKIYGL